MTISPPIPPPIPPPVSTCEAPADAVAADIVRPRALVTGVSQILGTHALAAVAGLASLPILARNLGPEGYGAFSLYMTLHGVLTYQDFIRPLLIRELASTPSPENRDRLAALSLATTWALSAVALVLGFVLLGPVAALAFAVSVAAFGCASLDYARLASAGRVGLASGIRNVAFAAATLAVAALSFTTEPGDHPVIVYAGPFVVANVAIALVYRGLTGEKACLVLGSESRRLARAAWAVHERSIRDLLGFSLATAVVVSADRVILKHASSAAEFGRYSACADIVAKLAIVGTALGTVLYPMLSRAVRVDAAYAARRFVHVASFVMCGWFLVVLFLVTFGTECLTVVLGRAFEPPEGLFALMLCGSFVHMLGFLITPWQRARGEFRTQTRAYAVSGALMIVVGLVCIPLLGAWGAALCYLSARSAELGLFVREARSLPKAALPRWMLATLAGMATLIVGATLLREGGG